MERRWQCPSCDRQLVTHDDSSQPRLHPCKKLGGLLAPFVQVTGLELDRSAARHVLVERGDYIGTDIVTVANGRPVMALSTERADGSNDLTVFAPTATAHLNI